ncbi:SDR family oxidoreductase [Algoriphagus marincola]|uniref:SDR family oxidoreductase n=1 Tax=Algoriphagus marincola TaxID=264027 RepID=A0ABS7N9L3_9BACT|nr:SDR family oxidoreductase [Algoriphagus marincola]MBY5952583.1 SDR family oxidoreductase [Algoriphagus marincola]
MQGKIILAGATGYLGSFIAQELKDHGHDFLAFGRSEEKLKKIGLAEKEFQVLDVTKLATFPKIEEPLDTVISTVGITRQKDGLSYMDVDYGANLNLLEFAMRHRARKFIYVSVLNGEQMRHLKITAAKERFVDALKDSGLEFNIIRPNGFFSDMKDFLAMAKSGRVYLFGDGEYKLNPIHGLDLARVVIDSITSPQEEIEAGGPDIFTQNEIGQLALEAMGKEGKVVHLPDFLRKAALGMMRTFTSSKTYGPIEFFLSMMAQDNVAPRHGVHRLDAFFREEGDKILE